MSFVLHQPAAPLRALVQSIWSADFDSPDTLMPGLIAPDAHVEFVFHLGGPSAMLRMGSSTWERLPRAMLYAQRSHCVRLRSTEVGTIVAFRTSAVVAGVILKRPMHELWDQPIALRDLLGESVEGMTDQLAVLAPSARFALIEHWLRKRLAAWAGEHHRIERLHEQLVWRSFGAPIEQTAASMGASLRSLRRWIGDAAGIAPKQLELSGRILRACAVLHERPDLTITAIAHGLGFADQAAFANAFRSQTAMTPRAFRAEPLVFYERGPA
jgi:AraC-like DNA-binding protein